MIYRVGLTLLGAKQLAEVQLAAADCDRLDRPALCKSLTRLPWCCVFMPLPRKLLLHVSSSCPRLFEWSRRRDDAHCVYAQGDRLRCLRQATAMNEGPAVEQ